MKTTLDHNESLHVIGSAIRDLIDPNAKNIEIIAYINNNNTVSIEIVWESDPKEYEEYEEKTAKCGGNRFG